MLSVYYTTTECVGGRGYRTADSKALEKERGDERLYACTSQEEARVKSFVPTHRHADIADRYR